ncbi:MAG: NAD(P)H-dependent oxidoreductase [Deltaproteobacteria bacterium]|nr:NAD(P)H-dependent oxidoreductase [Deltaproteobacteria bacterium]
MKIVGLSGGLTTPSLTTALVDFVVSQAITPLPHTTHLLDIAEIASELALTASRENASIKLIAKFEKIESADLLVVGTPIVKGSYTGLLKHLFDLLNNSKSENGIAIIAATDRGDCNSLALEYSLRPLLTHSGYYTVPTTVYARHNDFVDYRVAEEAVIVRARRSVGETFRILGLDPPLATFITNGDSRDPGYCN